MVASPHVLGTTGRLACVQRHRRRRKKAALQEQKSDKRSACEA